MPVASVSATIRTSAPCANAIFLTTNEFALFGSGFYGAQIYAISKQALVSGAASPNVVLFNGGDPSIPAPAFTVWPAISSGGQYAGARGGTEYLLSSDAVFYDSGTSNTVWLWAVSNTRLIDSAPQALTLTVSPLTVQEYAVPSSLVRQQPGSAPLRDCFATPGCAPTYLGYPNIVYSTPTSTRMYPIPRPGQTSMPCRLKARRVLPPGKAMRIPI